MKDDIHSLNYNAMLVHALSHKGVYQYYECGMRDKLGNPSQRYTLNKSEVTCNACIHNMNKKKRIDPIQFVKKKKAFKKY